MQSLTTAMPVGGAVLERPRGRLGRDRAHQRGVGLGREGRRVGQAAGERDHLGALGDRHQVAHGRGLHDLRARGEQPGVALEVARRRPRAVAHAVEFAAAAWVPGTVVYSHGPRDASVTRVVGRSPTPTGRAPLPRHHPGHGPRRRAGVRPFLPPCSRARSPAPTSASTSSGTRLRVLERPWFLLAVRGAADHHRGHRAPAPGPAETGGRRRRAGAAWPSAWARCCSPARWPTTARPGGRAGRRGLACAVARPGARRAALFGRRGRAPGRRRARGAARLRRRRVAGCSPPWRSSCRRCRSSILGFLAWLLDRRPPARGREVRRAARPALDAKRKKLVLGVIDGLTPDDARARASRTGARPRSPRCIDRGIYVDDCVSAFPSVTPVCAATHRHRHRPGRAPASRP